MFLELVRWPSGCPCAPAIRWPGCCSGRDSRCDSGGRIFGDSSFCCRGDRGARFLRAPDGPSVGSLPSTISPGSIGVLFGTDVGWIGRSSRGVSRGLTPGVSCGVSCGVPAADCVVRITSEIGVIGRSRVSSVDRSDDGSSSGSVSVDCASDGRSGRWGICRWMSQVRTPPAICDGRKNHWSPDW